MVFQPEQKEHNDDVSVHSQTHGPTSVGEGRENLEIKASSSQEVSHEESGLNNVRDVSACSTPKGLPAEVLEVEAGTHSPVRERMIKIEIMGMLVG